MKCTISKNEHTKMHLNLTCTIIFYLLNLVPINIVGQGNDATCPGFLNVSLDSSCGFSIDGTQFGGQFVYVLNNNNLFLDSSGFFQSQPYNVSLGVVNAFSHINIQLKYEIHTLPRSLSPPYNPTGNFCFGNLLLNNNLENCSAPFVTTWQTDRPGISCSTCVNIPTFGGGYNFDIDWENDGIYDTTGVTGSITHDYGQAGIYQIAIKGDFPRIYFNNDGDKNKIVSIDLWGVIAWSSMESAFYGCDTLICQAPDQPKLENVTSLKNMFRECSLFDGNIGGWNTSQVTDMSNMFYGCTNFDGPISYWDVGNVVDMSNMFYEASIFNQDLINWNINNVTNFSNTFYNAASFDQSLETWTFNSSADLTNMLDNCGMSCLNYDKTLVNWSNNPSIPDNITLGASGITYWLGQNARNRLLNNKNWTIVGDNYGECNYDLPCIPLTWLGITNEWSDPSNWDWGFVPQACNEVIIGSALDTLLINVDTAYVNRLTLPAGIYMQIGSNSVMILSNPSPSGIHIDGGELTNNGKIIIDEPIDGIINENGGSITNNGEIVIHTPYSRAILNKGSGTKFLNNNNTKVTMFIFGGFEAVINEDDAILELAPGSSIQIITP